MADNPAALKARQITVEEFLVDGANSIRIKGDGKNWNINKDKEGYEQFKTVGARFAIQYKDSVWNDKMMHWVEEFEKLDGSPVSQAGNTTPSGNGNAPSDATKDSIENQKRTDIAGRLLECLIANGLCKPTPKAAAQAVANMSVLLRGGFIDNMDAANAALDMLMKDPDLGVSEDIDEDIPF